ncbi:dTMP kinase [Kitasatospora sp. NBC_01250]|uniref:dTMP kinase n=1 Tax=unclassified Kitasatospora TaxID=2633591 RepID=UPI002E124538|nr:MULTISPECIES: dTMP kinase [unclassified Kitasatospora]WSJ64637.1 dTMP kinase [Kitasatospora sp. NBC_01302]
MYHALTRHLAACQRTVLVALALCPMILVTMAVVPALMVLPFLANGHQRATEIIFQLRRWTRIALDHSRTSPTTNETQ